MFIPLILGGGQVAKRKGSAGLRDCPVCGHETRFSHYEVHSQLSLFFLPAFTWDHREVVGCDVCGTKFEDAAP